MRVCVFVYISTKIEKKIAKKKKKIIIKPRRSKNERKKSKSNSLILLPLIHTHTFIHSFNIRRDTITKRERKKK